MWAALRGGRSQTRAYVMAEGGRWVRALKKCLPEAEVYLDVRPFLSTLQKEGILDAYEYANVRESINAIDRVRLVFEAAERKEVQYIKKFVEIIDLPGAGQWADMIRKEAGAFDQPPPTPDQEGDEEIDNPGKQEPKPQLAIITANETEQNVVRRYLKLGDSGRVCDEMNDYDWECDPFLQKKGVEIKLLEVMDGYEVFAIGKVTAVHVKCTKIGPSGAQKTTSDLLRKASEENWPLQVIFVVGCCGASMSDAVKKKKKNWRGTVLLSDQVENYLDGGKIENGKLVGRSETHSLSSDWRNKLSELSIVQPDVQDQRYSDIPIEKVDKYLSGSLVIKSEEEGHMFRGSSEMVGIEMEGTGVLNIVDILSKQSTQVTVVKGISDYASRDKNDKVRSVVFGKETEGEVEDNARQEIATFHAITLVARCVASKAHVFQ